MNEYISTHMCGCHSGGDGVNVNMVERVGDTILGVLIKGFFYFDKATHAKSHHHHCYTGNVMPVMCVMLGGGMVAKWSCG